MAPNDGEQAPQSGYRPLVQHAARWWAAEEETARRLSIRTNLQLTVVAAFLGLSGVRLLDAPLRSPTLNLVLSGLFLLALALLGMAALYLLSVGPLWTPPSIEAVRKERQRLTRRLEGYGRMMGRIWGIGPWLQREIERLTTEIRLDSGAPASSGLRIDPDILKLVRTEVGKLEESSSGPRFSAEYGDTVAFLSTYGAAQRLANLNVVEVYRIDRAQRIMLGGFAAIFLAIVLFTLAEKAPDTPDVIQIEVNQRPPVEVGGDSDGGQEGEPEGQDGGEGPAGASGPAGAEVVGEPEPD